MSGSPEGNRGPDEDEKVTIQVAYLVGQARLPFSIIAGLAAAVRSGALPLNELTALLGLK